MMHSSMCRVQRGSFVYYTCRRLPVRHAFTTKSGGVSTGACESLNLGFNRGDTEQNVRENYRRLAEELNVDGARFTLTRQIHEAEVSVVRESEAGMGLTRPMAWQSDAIVTALPDTPLIGFYADCALKPMRMCRRPWSASSVRRCSRSSRKKVRSSMWIYRASAQSCCGMPAFCRKM